MSDELTIKDKATILFKQGLIRYEDRLDRERIEARWLIYENVPQKTARGAKIPKPQ